MSSVPGIISSIPGSVAVVLGIVVGGVVVGGTVGLVVGATVVVGTVVAGASALRHPVNTHIARTNAKGRMMSFFILKPPENSDFKASISKRMGFTLVTFVEVMAFCHNFRKKQFLALLFFTLSCIMYA